MNLRESFQGLRARLLATYLIVIVLSLAVLVWRVGSWLEASRFAETRRDQEGRAILMASATEELIEKLALGEIDQAAFRADVLALAQEINQLMVITDARGQVLVASNEQAVVSRWFDSAELHLAYQGRIVQEIRPDSQDQGGVLLTAGPIRHDKELIGAVLLELPMSAVQATNRSMWMTLVGAALIAAAATVVVSHLFARSIVQPVTELTLAVTRVAEGDLQQRIQAAGPRELRQLAYGFNFMAERISTLVENQRAFVANASHELRTPLTTIRLRAEALRDGAKDEPELATQFLRDIEGETDRLSRLTEGLLNLARIESGQVERRRELISLEEIAREAADRFSEAAHQAQLSLSVTFPDDLPPVPADPDQIRQVFTNLIGNAIKFTPAGGAVIARGMLVNRVPHSQAGHGPWILVQVSDNGVGIPEEDVPHVFDRFYRSGKTRARELGGTGLGLAIAKSIIDAHGGSIWAECAGGRGTTISFTLPIH